MKEGAFKLGELWVKNENYQWVNAVRIKRND